MAGSTNYHEIEPGSKYKHCAYGTIVEILGVSFNGRVEQVLFIDGTDSSEWMKVETFLAYYIPYYGDDIAHD